MEDGTHPAALVVDGKTVQHNTFTVTTLWGKSTAAEPARNVSQPSLPSPGELTTLRWQEPAQNSVIVPPEEEAQE